MKAPWPHALLASRSVPRCATRTASDPPGFEQDAPAKLIPFAASALRAAASVHICGR